MKREKTSRPVAEKITTGIWADIDIKGVDGNTEEVTVCRGYDFYGDLLGKYSYNELILLLLKGELPSKKESLLLDVVMSSLINPGPRHWATQAAMTASIAKTTIGNSLLTGMAVMQGRYNGALAVEKSMEMFQEYGHQPELSEKKWISEIQKKYSNIPGYGFHYHERDKRAIALVRAIRNIGDVGRYVQFALKLESEIQSDVPSLGYLTLDGAVSAVLSDLELSPADGHGLFLLSAGPGLLAHLIEQRAGSWSSFPFYDAPEYTGEKEMRIAEEHLAYGGEK